MSGNTLFALEEGVNIEMRPGTMKRLRAEAAVQMAMATQQIEGEPGLHPEDAEILTQHTMRLVPDDLLGH